MFPQRHEQWHGCELVTWHFFSEDRLPTVVIEQEAAAHLLRRAERTTQQNIQATNNSLLICMRLVTFHYKEPPGIEHQAFGS